jgi:hypothetical protein
MLSSYAPRSKPENMALTSGRTTETTRLRGSGFQHLETPLTH